MSTTRRCTQAGLLLVLGALLGAGCPGAAPECGDDRCDREGGEDEQSCPEDCGQGICGNAVCDSDETSQSCPVDCYCGNGSCDSGESLNTCASDCPNGLCGNGLCEAVEDNNDCPEDCPDPVCGNDACEQGEDMLSCLADCPTPLCGNGTCEPGEDNWSCLADCPPVCANGTLDNGEECDGALMGSDPPSCQDLQQNGGVVICGADCRFSTQECYACNDGVCELSKGESYAECPVDCGFTAVFAGGDQTCAVRGDGTAWCWGGGTHCQIGDGECVNRHVPTQVLGIDNAVAMAVGELYHNCALLDDGTARCWGSNGWGVLGDGTVTTSATPVVVSNLNDAIALEACFSNTCALRADGSTWCWGEGGGTLGVANPPDLCQPPPYTSPHECAWTPQQTSVGADGVDLAMKSNSACVLETSGHVKCWGIVWSDANGGGTIWGGLDTVDGTPLATDFDSAPTHGCILDAVGGVWCWGSNEGGQLGNGTAGGGSELVARVAGLPPAMDVATGGRAQPWSHSCALDTTGHVWCWGYNTHGQLGTGSWLNSYVPAPVVGLSNVVQIAAGGEHTCALDSDAVIWCWGWNEAGQVGDNSTWSRNAPEAVIIP